VHRHLGISHDHFDVMAELFGEALEMHGMSERDIKTALGAIEGKRSIIVSRDAA
jgi:hemoglobin